MSDEGSRIIVDEDSILIVDGPELLTGDSSVARFVKDSVGRKPKSKKAWRERRRKQ